MKILRNLMIAFALLGVVGAAAVSFGPAAHADTICYQLYGGGFACHD